MSGGARADSNMRSTSSNTKHVFNIPSAKDDDKVIMVGSGGVIDLYVHKEPLP